MRIVFILGICCAPVVDLMSSVASDMSLLAHAFGTIDAGLAAPRVFESKDYEVPGSPDEPHGKPDLSSWRTYLPAWFRSNKAPSQPEPVADGGSSEFPAPVEIPLSPELALLAQKDEEVSSAGPGSVTTPGNEVPGFSGTEAMGWAALGAAGAAALARRNPGAAARAAQKALAAPKKIPLLTAGKPVVKPQETGFGSAALRPQVPGGKLADTGASAELPSIHMPSTVSEGDTGSSSEQDAHGFEVHPEVMSPDMMDVAAAAGKGANDSDSESDDDEEPEGMSPDTEQMVKDLSRFDENL